MKHVFGGVHICESCVNKILETYVIINPLRMLCPFCYGKEGNRNKCKYCDIKSMPGSIANEN